MKKETWVVIHAGYYAVSNQGRVRRVKLHNSSRKGGFLKEAFTPRGYAHVGLSVRQVVSARYIHHLVAEAFLPPRPKGLQINHKGGNKKNNRASNLEYVTPGENVRHAMRLGLCPHMKRRKS